MTDSRVEAKVTAQLLRGKQTGNGNLSKVVDEPFCFGLMFHVSFMIHVSFTFPSCSFHISCFLHVP